jgi:hypothetical protein
VTNMNNVLINIEIYSYPLAFLLFFIGGIKIFSRTRNKAMALFSCGAGLVVLGQIAISISYQIYPVSFEPESGIAPSNARDVIISIVMWLNFIGLLVASMSFLSFAFKRVGPIMSLNNRVVRDSALNAPRHTRKR